MPVLTRMVSTPVVVDVRRGALDDLAPILADQRISTSGRIAIAVSPSSGAALRERLAGGLPGATWYPVTGGTLDAAVDLAERMRGGAYDAVVGLGGGRVLDVTKYAAARVGLPMVSVATNLAHDGIASPVSILDNDAGRGSYGVPLPIGVVVDLDVVRAAPVRFVRSGIGDALSNLCAVADWELSAQVTGEAVDGLAVALARTAAEALLHRTDGVGDAEFLTALAEALIMSGIAMTVAGTTRPCSGACHEVSHAIDLVVPAKAGLHGEQVALGAAFATYLRGDSARTEKLVECLVRHDLPVLPEALGLTLAEFAEVVRRAPDTRPGRFTILEHLDLDADQIRDAVEGYVKAVDS
jgi:glycerol-1-phosphate dehydrogenase [NAD(P)+]